MCGEQFGCGDAHNALDRLGLARGHQGHAPRCIGHGAHMIGKVRPCLGDLQGAANAFKKGDAQLFLKRGDLTSQGGLRLIEHTRRRRERTCFYDRQKRACVVPIE